MFILKILIGISVFITVCIMFAGAFSMTKMEGDGRKSNMMMRYRVLSQFVTVLLIVLYLWMS
ncbi:MAG: twin transmembrane helix small protein [Kordiimonadaceae bacterium]|nr:twin transmembrane helix small protein [Kordiimonadaceae bacterium]MBT6033954.1 twin transmembrane helix small protein [Kordiimonadaceae bacterium]